MRNPLIGFATGDPMSSFLLTGLAGLALAASSSGAPSPKACAAVEPLLASAWAQTPPRPRLSPEAATPFRGKWKHASELRQGGWSGPAPSAALLHRWELSGSRNALDCANIQSLARSKGIEPSSGEPEATVIGLPVVDASGSEALAQVTTRRKMLGGSVYLYLLRWSEGRWTVVSQRMLVIS
jgi:hypothetical protein